MHSYQQYKGRHVAKVFPLHGDEPFSGVVVKALDNAKDGLPFFIKYSDGDKEWVSINELLTILVDEEEGQAGKQRKGASASKSSGKGPGRKRKADDGEAPAATGTNTQGTPAAAARASQGGTQSQPSAKRSSAAAAKHTPSAVLTAAAGGASAAAAERPPAVASSSKPGKKPSAAAAAAAAAAPAVSTGGAPSDASPSLFKSGLGLASRAVAAVVGRALQDDKSKSEQEQQQERKPWQAPSASAGGPPQRSTYNGPGAAGMPSTSSFVRAGGHVYLSLCSSPSTLPGARPDYSAEVQQVLSDLDSALGEVSSSKRRLLTVRIYFRDINAGLHKFTPLWNDWVDPETLPVLTLVEGAGMAGSSVTLEAVALATSSAATD